MPLPVSLPELLEAASVATLERVHTVLPARVLRFYPDKQAADIEYLVKASYVNAEGVRESFDLPNIAEAPVAYLRGGGFFFAAPLAPGDAVWAWTTEEAIGHWRVSGEKSEGNLWRFAAGSVFVLPGAFAMSAALGDVSATELVLGRDGAAQQIRISASEIRLGKTASQAVALAPNIETALALIVDHTHAVSGSTAAPSSALSAMPTTCAATIVKGQ